MTEQGKHMHYRLKEGVVLVSMCGGFFIFPSRKSGLPSLILSVSSGMAELLMKNTIQDIKPSDEERKKLSRLQKCGFIEEFD